MRRRLVSFVVITLATVASLADAQVTTAPANQQAAFFALLLTPAGALPQLARVRRPIDTASRGDVAVRYGRYSLQETAFRVVSYSNFGLGGTVQLSRRVRVGATVGDRSCNGCEGSRMGSVDLEASLFRKAAGGEIGGDTDFGLQVSAGMGKAKKSDVTGRSFTLSLPLAVSLPQQENALLTLFVAPSLAYGSLTTTGVTEGTTRFMIAAGLGYSFGFGLGLHAAVSRIAIDDSPTQLGFAMSWRFGRT